MRIRKKIMALMLAGAMVTTGAGCGQKAATVDGFTYTWVNSNLEESVDETANAELKDDCKGTRYHQL